MSPTLIRHLVAHHTERGEGDPRYRDGHPLTYRRYDHLWARIGQHLPWVAAQQISTHWLRHTTLTWVERTSGHAVAQEYAGHTDNGANTRPQHTWATAYCGILPPGCPGSLHPNAGGQLACAYAVGNRLRDGDGPAGRHAGSTQPPLHS
ncbi:hypothetical protein Vau01_121440 [Virgisporangium aurantiacum]|uniref:Phage integrase family protein n=1 Tax=Virgisporangium aurantiacum TaxID=175570 RepID=A0A8J3ZN21_9ACTN|nr:hypothetical protein Vau01_121440 [Virgisporangium aurantiacum]